MVDIFSLIWRKTNLLLLALLLFAFPARAQEITAIDFNGNVLGKIIPDGKVVSFDNKILGNVTADSLILDSKGKVIGGVVPQGVAIGNDAKPLGRVGSDGQVRNLAGQTVGKVLPNGLVVNEYFEIIGQVIFPGLVYNDEGKISGRITGDGLYSDLNGNQIGIVTPDGYAYKKIEKDYILDGRLISSRMVVSLSGDFIGSVVPGGQVTDFNSETIGYIKANELVYDNKNSIIGGIVNTGYAFDNSGEYIGLVSYNGSVIKDNNTVGKIRADSRIVNTSGNVIGVVHPFAAVATDLQGRYLGRLNPNGEVFKDSSSIGRVGSRGYVFDKEGNIQGQLVSSGPVYDYKGDLVGHATHNGSVISLNGSTIGYMIGRQAYNLSGVVIGSVLKNAVIYDKTDMPIGVCGISSKFNYKGTDVKLSPFGYVWEQKGGLAGKLQPLDTFYTPSGSRFAYLELSGQAVKLGGNDVQKLISGNYVLDNKDKITARNIPATIAVSAEGKLIGTANQENMLLNKTNQQVGKILPDTTVTNAGSSNYIPKTGQAYSEYFALDFKGNMLGYLNLLGEVVSYNGSKIGYAVEKKLVSDNNGVLVGFLQGHSVVKNDKCETIGVTDSQGGVYNYRGNFVGKILGNSNVISESGAVLGTVVADNPIIDFSGQVIGYIDYKGSVVNAQKASLGCLDNNGRLRNADKEWIGGQMAYGPVVNFGGKVIGYTTIDGSVVDDNNNVFAYQQPDGNVNSTAGLSIGSVMKYKVAFDLDNKFLGYVDNQGKVLDSQRKSVGRVDFEGNVVSGKNKIGYALEDFYVYDNKGITAGIISRDGEVSGFKNQNLGVFDKGFVIQNNEIVARGSRDYNIRDSKNNIMGEIQLDGKVLDHKGNVVGTIDNDGALKNAAGETIAQAYALQYYHKSFLKSPSEANAISDNVLRDKDGNIIGYVMPDGTVVDEKGKVIGKVDADGKLVNNQSDGVITDENGNIIGYIMPDGTVVDEKGNVIGKVNENGELVDAQGNVIGKIEADGTIKNANGEVIGRKEDNKEQSKKTQDIMSQLQRKWYQKSSEAEQKIIAPTDKDIDDDISNIVLGKGNQYYKSLGIALTPDGEYLGDIMENDEVVNENGDVIGYRMPDGLIIDNEGNLIGTEEAQDVDIKELTEKDKKDVFIPAGTFGPGGAYGIGTGPTGNLGPGGGYGPGERYDPTRQAALNAAMKERRGSISVGKISTGTRKEAFDGYQKDWSEQGIPKSISSWRVDMSEMIFSDKPIPAVIARAIDTNNPAPVTAYVERNVYAEEGRNIIIPAGSRLIGSFGGIGGPAEATSNSARVQISWERLIRPDGSIFVFGGQTADAQGRAGALGYVDQQLLKQYTLPALTTVLSSSVAYIMATNEKSSGETENSKQQAASDARQNFLDDMQNIFDEILADKTNVKAMTYIPNGTRIIIYPNTDLWLRSFELDKEESQNGGNFHGLIDKDVTETSANVAPGQPTYGPGGPTSTLTGEGGGSVVYNPDEVNVGSVGSSSMPLVNSSPAPQRKSVTPPPPPNYGVNQMPSRVVDTDSNTTSSSSSSNDSVPALF